MNTISFREDATGRRWRAHLLVRRALRRRIWTAGGIAAFVGAFAFYRSRALSCVLFLASWPAIVNVGFLLGYPFLRWIPQRWILTEQRITGRGGWEIGAVRWSDITIWSVTPIDALPGYRWLGWMTSDRKSNGIVLSPAAPREEVEACFRELAPGEEQPPLSTTAHTSHRSL